MFTHKLSFFSLDQDIIDCINSLPPGTKWTGKKIVDDVIKPAIRAACINNQNNECAYCELDIRPEDDEIDHIAEKSDHKSETFNLHNMVVTCHRCNGSRCKHDKEIVLNKIGDYDNWEFSIVHPYLDDPKDYYDYSWFTSVIQIKEGITDVQREKANKNLEIFKLNTSAMIDERKHNRFRKASKHMKKILRISSYKPE